MKGFVKYIKKENGYLFLDVKNQNDVFAHASQCEGFETLVQGAFVEFELKEGKKGLYATNVKIIL